MGTLSRRPFGTRAATVPGSLGCWGITNSRRTTLSLSLLGLSFVKREIAGPISLERQAQPKGRGFRGEGWNAPKYWDQWLSQPPTPPPDTAFPQVQVENTRRPLGVAKWAGRTWTTLAEPQLPCSPSARQDPFKERSGGGSGTPGRQATCLESP